MPLKFLSGGPNSRPTPLAAVYTLRHDSASFAVHKLECDAASPRSGPPPSHARLASILPTCDSLRGGGAVHIAPLRAPDLFHSANFSAPPPRPRSPVTIPTEMDIAPIVPIVPTVSAVPIAMPSVPTVPIAMPRAMPLPLRHAALPLRLTGHRAVPIRPRAAYVNSHSATSATGTSWAALSAAAVSWAAQNHSCDSRHTVCSTPLPSPLPLPLSLRQVSLEWLCAAHDAAEERCATLELHMAARPRRDPPLAWHRRTVIPQRADVPMVPVVSALETIAGVSIGLDAYAVHWPMCPRAAVTDPIAAVPMALPTAPRVFPLVTARYPPHYCHYHQEDLLPLIVAAPRPLLRGAPILRRAQAAKGLLTTCPPRGFTPEALPFKTELRIPRGAFSHLTLALRNAAADKLSALRRQRRAKPKPFTLHRQHYCRPASIAAVTFSAAIDGTAPLQSATDAVIAFAAQFRAAVLFRSDGRKPPLVVPSMAAAVIRWAARSVWVPLSEDCETNGEGSSDGIGGVFPRDVELRSFTAYRMRSGEGIHAVFLDDVATMPRAVRNMPGVVEDAQMHYCYRLALEQAREKLGMQ